MLKKVVSFVIIFTCLSVLVNCGAVAINPKEETTLGLMYKLMPRFSDISIVLSPTTKDFLRDNIEYLKGIKVIWVKNTDKSHHEPSEIIIIQGKEVLSRKSEIEEIIRQQLYNPCQVTEKL